MVTAADNDNGGGGSEAVAVATTTAATAAVVTHTITAIVTAAHCPLPAVCRLSARGNLLWNMFSMCAVIRN